MLELLIQAVPFVCDGGDVGDDGNTKLAGWIVLEEDTTGCDGESVGVIAGVGCLVVGLAAGVGNFVIPALPLPPAVVDACSSIVAGKTGIHCESCSRRREY